MWLKVRAQQKIVKVFQRIFFHFLCKTGSRLSESEHEYDVVHIWIYGKNNVLEYESMKVLESLPKGVL